jgi:hypothetical protein
MRNFSDNILEEMKKKIFSITPPPLFVNVAVYEIMWKNIVERGRPQMTMWSMRITCWIIKATNSQYVILTAFPLQQWLQDST